MPRNRNNSLGIVTMPLRADWGGKALCARLCTLLFSTGHAPFAEPMLRKMVLVQPVRQRRRNFRKRTSFPDQRFSGKRPAIDPSVALPLLMFEKHFHGNQDEYTSLQKRCVTSIIANWEVFKQGFPSMGEMTAALQSLPSEVLAAILITSRRANF